MTPQFLAYAGKPYGRKGMSLRRAGQDAETDVAKADKMLGDASHGALVEGTFAPCSRSN